jgi:hypothetical protein
MKGLALDPDHDPAMRPIAFKGRVRKLQSPLGAGHSDPVDVSHKLVNSGVARFLGTGSGVN